MSRLSTRFLCALGLLLLARPAVAVEKFALAVYHFNVQYVEGGLIGFPDGMSESDIFNMNEEAVEDQIITQSFEPLLDVYLNHPLWGADFEMQGLMLDIIVQRHPDTLRKMKILAQAGKVSFDSFHWSDQFWIAYPRVDMERSHDLVVKSFQNAGIPLGTSIFTQEGQFSIGMERFFRERGIRTAIVAGGVMGATVNAPTDPINTLGSSQDVLAVVAPCGSHAPSTAPDSNSACNGPQDDKVQVIWDWRDDGELAVTGGGDPYLGKSFTYKADVTAQFEQQLMNEEANGFQHVSVADYADQVIALGEPTPPLPQVVEGVWHHDVFLWMGGTSIEDLVLPGTSADNAVHTLAMQAHRKLRQAEEAVAQIKAQHTDPGLDAQIEQAWKDLLMGEGSDGSGQNPWLAERQYSMRHSQAALDAANAILANPAIANYVVPAPAAPKLNADSGPFQPVADPESTRPPTFNWQKRDGKDIWELTVTFPANEDERDLKRRKLRIDFPRTGDDLIWSGSLEDGQVRTLPLANITGTDVALPDGGSEATAMIPAANGLVGLGGGTYLIERLETVHLAIQLPKDEPVVRIKDDTADVGEVTWKFIVVKGAEADALAEAKATNVDPDPLGPSKASSKGEGKSCGCDMSVVDASGFIALLGVLSRHRRRSSYRSP